jgi:hypothetical protein
MNNSWTNQKLKFTIKFRLDIFFLYLVLKLNFEKYLFISITSSMRKYKIKIIFFSFLKKY